MTREVVVVFGAHPDDLDWGSGGTTAAWTRQGKEVYYVLTTSGEGGRIMPVVWCCQRRTWRKFVRPSSTERLPF